MKVHCIQMYFRIYSRNAHSSGGNLKGFGFSSQATPVYRANYPPFPKTQLGFSIASLGSTEPRQPPLEQPYRSSRVCFLMFLIVFDVCASSSRSCFTTFYTLHTISGGFSVSRIPWPNALPSSLLAHFNGTPTLRSFQQRHTKTL